MVCSSGEALEAATTFSPRRSSHDHSFSMDVRSRRIVPQSSFGLVFGLVLCLGLGLVAAGPNGQTLSRRSGHTPDIIIQSPVQEMIHTKVGCGTNFSFKAVDDPFNSTRLWAEFNNSFAFPPHTEVVCNGHTLLKDGLQVCEGSYNLAFTPTTKQAGRSYTVCVIWQAGDSGPGAPVEAEARKCVTLTVVRPDPRFTDKNVGHAAAFTRTFNVGCMNQIRIAAKDFAGDNSLCGMYPVVVEAVPEGSYPRSASGLPEGMMAGDGSGLVGGAELEPVGMMGDEMEYSFRWWPARGQESSIPYRICFQARHPDLETGRVACLSVKVQKCQFCAREGDSMTSIAADFNTDWLHLYTANPTILDPDHLPSGQVLNTGVLYEVREGDYLELLAERFFTSPDMIRAVNPDVAAAAHLMEGSELCIMPPVCGVECVHGLDCHPVP